MNRSSLRVGNECYVRFPGSSSREECAIESIRFNSDTSVKEVEISLTTGETVWVHPKLLW